MNANTTETDIETQPPWDLIALLVLAFIVLGWMALAVSYNPSRGAQHTFESLHSVVLHQYQTLPWRSFLTEMHSRHGPALSGKLRRTVARARSQSGGVLASAAAAGRLSGCSRASSSG